MNPPSHSRHIKIIQPDMLLAGYAAGYFPMAESRTGPIHWYSPDPRAIIPLDSFKVPRSLRQVIAKGKFEIGVNTSFETVIRSCSDRDETWISEEIIQTYCALHQVGFAHSVEAWHQGTLAGGLYGVALGAAFFGESMFTLVPDASKVALQFLVERLRKNGFELLDSQMVTPHLAKLGAVEIPRDEYIRRLKLAVSKRRSFLA